MPSERLGHAETPAASHISEAHQASKQPALIEAPKLRLVRAINHRENTMTNTPEGPRAFARFLEQLSDGDAHAELSHELHKLTTALADLANATQGRAKGTLSLKLSLSVDCKGVAAVSYDITTKEPKPSGTASVFWLTHGNNLSVENPRQPNLPVREVKGEEDARELENKDTDARSV